ncbi:MAG: hypothetical protein DRN11_03815 [Thermoplasmata archaeon]|nr:MAG: hypothetical protein DRN11_03815 [Thermoplasmata archaeon]
MLNYSAQVMKDIWDVAKLIAIKEKSIPAEVVLSILIAYYKLNYGSHPLIEEIIRRRKCEEILLEVIA